MKVRTYFVRKVRKKKSSAGNKFTLNSAAGCHGDDGEETAPVTSHRSHTSKLITCLLNEDFVASEIVMKTSIISLQACICVTHFTDFSKF